MNTLTLLFTFSNFNEQSKSLKYPQQSDKGAIWSDEIMNTR
jgi:hypothetical protein